MLTEQPNWLMQRAQLTPERIALIYRDQTVTFAELFAASKRMAAQLAAHSVRKGDTRLFCSKTVQKWYTPFTLVFCLVLRRCF